MIDTDAKKGKNTLSAGKTPDDQKGENPTEVLARSEELTDQEKKALSKFVSGFTLKKDAMKALGIKTRQTFRNVTIGGSGHPTTIATVRSVINPQN